MNVEQRLEKIITSSTEIGHCSNNVNSAFEPIVVVASVDNDNENANSEDIGNEFSCVICDMCLPTNEDLDEHLLSHAKDNSHNIVQSLRSSKTNSMYENIYRNSLRCANYSLTKKHLRSNCKSEAVTLRSKSSGIQSQQKNTDNFNCTNCSDIFPCKKDLQNHMKSHQTYICIFCCVTFLNRDMFESHPCHSSLSVDNYATTKMINNIEMPFQCYICGCIFETRPDLTIHLANHNSDSFRCEECGFQFKNKRKLRAHRASHPKKIPICEVCGKVFGHVNLLVNHLRTHTQEKPFSCNICGKNFAQHDYLKTHKRIHTREKPFLCADCGKTFITQTQLQCHMKIHTDEKSYVCEICKTAFRLSHHLKKHYRIHTQEKPHSCEYCGKAFARRDCLKQHIRVHTKEKPYKCKICGKCFSQGSSVRLHQKVHTKDKDLVS